MSTDTRDQELEELQADLNRPYIHEEEPSEREAKNGEVCWHNANRICAPDCLAYNRLIPMAAGADRCLMLSAVATIADAALEFVQLRKKDDARASKKQQDQARSQAASVQPPDPRGPR